ncbi:hypothetical protein PHYPSEUDO_008102 [Phytophthora pseudosyringae]|uniref:Uncharacterized protein n=1 Tax=Phytophthora pseudosyringae TaxID=221518 RepID=A0A8T1VFT6_9STRA|nr:hypothetical protein PHYPSEUDO_008102 [Phytophthora pseudosyringae]
MEVADLRDILERRRELQLRERRARRCSELKLSQKATATAKAPIAATTLSDVECVTTRPGFLRQQLEVAGLTPLRRWSLQLQLVVAEDAKTQRAEVDDDDDVATAMQFCEATLLRDTRCYDVVYRAGVRVADAREWLLDESAPVDVREALSFSTRCESVVCRVTCVHDGTRVLFSATQHVDNLQTELGRLLNDEETGSADAVIRFLWTALKA